MRSFAGGDVRLRLPQFCQKFFTLLIALFLFTGFAVEKTLSLDVRILQAVSPSAQLVRDVFGASG